MMTMIMMIMMTINDNEYGDNGENDYGDDLMMMTIASSADNSKSNLGVGISFQSQSIRDENPQTSQTPPLPPYNTPPSFPTQL